MRLVLCVRSAVKVIHHGVWTVAQNGFYHHRNMRADVFANYLYILAVTVVFASVYAAYFEAVGEFNREFDRLAFFHLIEVIADNVEFSSLLQHYRKFIGLYEII